MGVYYRFIAWLIPLTWILALWALIASIWAASTKTNMYKTSEAALTSVGDTKVIKVYLKPLRITLIWLGLTGTMEWVAWEISEKVVGFYRWSDQEWWNYDPADAP